MTRYFAVVETGSCSTDYQRWEEKANCHHAHKTFAAAQKCLEKKQRWYCNHGRIAGTPCRSCLGSTASRNSTSALWYNGRIHNQSQERVGGES